MAPNDLQPNLYFRDENGSTKWLFEDITKGIAFIHPKNRASGIRIVRRTASSDKGGQDRFLRLGGGSEASL